MTIAEFEENDILEKPGKLTVDEFYQALTEKRPYKDGMSHEQSISIMQDMVRKGELDEKVVQDMSVAMA